MYFPGPRFSTLLDAPLQFLFSINLRPRQHNSPALWKDTPQEFIPEFPCPRAETCYRPEIARSSFDFHSDVPTEELTIENKGFSTVLILRRGSTIRFGHESAASDPLIPTRKGTFTPCGSRRISLRPLPGPPSRSAPPRLPPARQP